MAARIGRFRTATSRTILWGLGVSEMTDRSPSRGADRPCPRRDGETESKAAARNRIQNQAKWVDLQIQQAMARGDFDDLPGKGKPIKDLGSAARPRLVGQAS